jgi:subtilisin family serine protease
MLAKAQKRLVRRLGTVIVAALLICAPPALGAADPLRGQQWNLDMVGADGAHRVTRGDGAVVAVLDTGVDAAHQDLQGRLLPGHDFVQNDETPQDGDGHGTHVTGIVVANEGNGVGVASVAPGAKVLPIRVLGDDGSGSDSVVAAGIDYAIAHRVDVINLSLGGLPLDGIAGGSEFSAAIQRAVDAGIVVVAAAGNDSLPICEQPSVNGQILCVGAVDRRGARSFFSSGDDASIMAPGGSGAPIEGEDVLSTLPGSTYGEIAGTSQATPHVSGVAALLASRGVRGQAAIDRILATARDAGVPGPDPVYGVGILDANAAVAGLPAAQASGGGGSGTGSGSGSGSGPGATAGRVTLARSFKISTVLRRGIRARCRPAAAGTCRVTIKRGRRTLARGAVRVRTAGRTTTFTVRLTSAGKRLLRRGRTFRATAALAAAGVPERTLKVTFRR